MEQYKSHRSKATFFFNFIYIILLICTKYPFPENNNFFLLKKVKLTLNMLSYITSNLLLGK